MIRYLLATIEFIMHGFGYKNLKDFVNSFINLDYASAIISVSVVLGCVASFIEQYLGLTPLAYLSFILLIIIEFFTGIKASMLSGVKIQSRKISRMILKISIYTILIGILHSFTTEIKIPSMIGFDLNLYSWAEYSVLTAIIFHLIISVLENLVSMGLEEASWPLKMIKSKFGKWFEFKRNDD